MQYEYILMVIPIIIIVAFLVVIAKRMTDGERPDISGAVLGTIIIAVGLLIMVPIIESTDPYDYDSGTKTFTVSGNITGTDFSWGSAANAENLIIEEGVRSISAGAFASFEDLKYISIPVSIEELGENVFGVTLKDYLDQTITAPQAGEYVGTGNGTLYYCDPSMFTYSSNGGSITGLASEASSAVNLVIPNTNDGTAITAIGSAAFRDNTNIARVYTFSDSSLTNVFSNAFNGCTALAAVMLPTLEATGTSAFYGCTSLTELDLPDSLATIAGSSFRNCEAVTSIVFPASITSISTYAFSGMTGVTSVTFDEEFSATLGSPWNGWTFYDSDGTTALDSTDASNLAGYTFQGTASALVKVLPDRSTLTAAQTLQVQELTRTAAMTLKLEESELQISEKAELAEA